ncbi:reverse transcriptase domain-containing protein [Tanacetum coccineum]
MTMKVLLHHYGRFISPPEREFVGEMVATIDPVELDTFSTDQVKLILTNCLGYDENSPKFLYIKKPNCSFDSGLVPLADATKERDMILTQNKTTLKTRKLKKFNIEWEIKGIINCLMALQEAHDDDACLEEQILSLMHRFADRFTNRRPEVNKLMTLADHPLIEYGRYALGNLPIPMVEVKNEESILKVEVIDEDVEKIDLKSYEQHEDKISTKVLETTNKVGEEGSRFGGSKSLKQLVNKDYLLMNKRFTHENTGQVIFKRGGMMGIRFKIEFGEKKIENHSIDIQERLSRLVATAYGLMGLNRLNEAVLVAHRATRTLYGIALTWWNTHVKTVGHDAAYGMPLKTLMKMMTAKYCPQNKIKKLEIEIWDLKVKGTNLASYTQRFEELALMCGRMFPEESDVVEKYVGGLPDMIQGNVMSTKPKTIEEAVEMANNLMDQKLRTLAERQIKNKKKQDENFINN